MRSPKRKFSRELARRLLWWRFRLTQRHRVGHLVIEEVHGQPILVLPNVFNPKLLRSGELLAETLYARAMPANATVLDLGTGSGVGAVFAARSAARVVATDINPDAVRCAQMNALLHHCEDKIETRVGDLFEPTRDEQFDLILFNPPFYRGHPMSLGDSAWRSTDVFDRFLREVPLHLERNGCALVVLSDDAEVTELLHSATHLQVCVLRQERVFINETLTVYEIRSGHETQDHFVQPPK
jgi:release factor glutamine methyltransferase